MYRRTSDTTLDEVVDCGNSTARTEETTYGLKAISAPGTCAECTYLFDIYTSYACQAAEPPQSSCSLSLPPKVWQWMRESAAMTRMMPGAAEVMPEASPVPLL